MKSLLIIAVSTVFLFAIPGMAFGPICPSFPCVVDSSGTGEVASAAIDNFLAHATESHERIFVIARLGKSETNAAQNLTRLCEAREFVLNRLSGGGNKDYLDLLPVLFAEGGAVEGEGRLEFYLGSKLHLTRYMKSNRSANLDCCFELTAAEIKRKKNDCIAWKKGGL